MNRPDHVSRPRFAFDVVLVSAVALALWIGVEIVEGIEEVYPEVKADYREAYRTARRPLLWLRVWLDGEQ